MIFCKLSIEAWIKYESEPIGTQITYRYGDDDKGGPSSQMSNFNFRKDFFYLEKGFDSIKAIKREVVTPFPQCPFLDTSYIRCKI